MDVCVEEATKDHVFAHWGRAAIVVWRGHTTVEAMRRGSRVFEKVLAQRGEPLLMLSVIEPGASLPPLDARVELVRFMKRGLDQIERSAVVVEGEGFKVTSVRAVIAGLCIFSTPKFPHRVFSNVGAASRFLAGGRGGEPAPHLLIRAVKSARRTRPTPPFPTWLPTDDAFGPVLRRGR